MTLVRRAGQRWPFIGVFAAALAMRLPMAIAQGSDLGGDEPEYEALARGLLEAGRFESKEGFNTLVYPPAPTATAFRPPGLPAFVALVYWLTWPEPVNARIALAGLNAVAAAFLVFLGRQTSLQPKMATIVGFSWAIWPSSVLGGSTDLMSESLGIPICIAAFSLLLWSAKRGSAVGTACAGLGIGACALARVTFVLLVPLLALWLLSALPLSRLQRIWLGTTFCAGAVAVLLPWALRNHSAVGTYALATQADPLSIGNSRWARGSIAGEFYHEGSEQVV